MSNWTYKNRTTGVQYGVISDAQKRRYELDPVTRKAYDYTATDSPVTQQDDTEAMAVKGAPAPAPAEAKKAAPMPSAKD